MLGVELDCLVVLTKALERNAQVAIHPAFPVPVPKLTGNVETFVVKPNCLLVLTKPTECNSHFAIRNAFPGPVPRTLTPPCFNHSSLAHFLGRVQGSLALRTWCARVFVRSPVFLLALARAVAHRTAVDVCELVCGGVWRRVRRVRCVRCGGVRRREGVKA